MSFGQGKRAAWLGLWVVMSGGCRDQRTPGREPQRDTHYEVIRQYAQVAFAAYSDAVDAARRLQQAVDGFVTHPTAGGLEAARAAWLAARVPYLQTEAFRFYDGPIDRVEPLVNAWPVDESYIDFVTGDRKLYPELTAELLVALNEKEGEKNISTGFHAIEFLLWGEDRDDHGPGARSHADYQEANKGAARRGRYLRLLAELLPTHLQVVAADWDPAGKDNFRARLQATPPAEALALVIKGLGMLSGPELGGERLTVSYETKDQENEHSCFSDNTHNDVVFDLVGIQNVYLGRYVGAAGRTTSGPGLHDLLARVDRPLAKRLAAEIEASLAAARAIPPPFDRAIVGDDTTPGRVAIKKTIQALQTQTDTLTRAAAALEVRLALHDPKTNKR